MHGESGPTAIWRRISVGAKSDYFHAGGEEREEKKRMRVRWHVTDGQMHGVSPQSDRDGVHRGWSAACSTL